MATIIIPLDIDDSAVRLDRQSSSSEDDHHSTSTRTHISSLRQPAMSHAHAHAHASAHASAPQTPPGRNRMFAAAVIVGLAR
jgi:hypothetical protein